MRFLKNGPAIPDELLTAQDEGRVVFFCGAGVSRARAFLPDFFELANSVMESLGALADSPSRKLVKEAVSADRVFGSLEREFQSSDVRKAVASALKPAAEIDLSAHRTMLQLSKRPDGKVRVVTTNFDLLFEACDRKLVRYQYPKLPNPRRDDDFIGIVHLHGHVADSYDNATGDGFVLSSAEFGRAYLAEGWATAFVRTIMESYYVVFVGYAADDPPVQYLLEAMSQQALARRNLYAFQSGTDVDAQARWQQKGVHAIAYDSANNHQALWDTLAEWANRTTDPDLWAKRIIGRACSGPSKLAPHERGQVFHLISTDRGAKKFAEAKRSPPATWLSVFDPRCRFERPRHRYTISRESVYVDPFDDYGLDSDPLPYKIDPDDHYSKREIPPGVQNAFALNGADRPHLNEASVSGFQGHANAMVRRLPHRLVDLAIWLSHVADQPAAMWWAIEQGGLHPFIQNQIRWQLRRSKSKRASLALNAWEYLFHTWETNGEDLTTRTYDLKAKIERDGWSTALVREYLQLQRPRLEASRPFHFHPISQTRRPRLRDLISLDVKYLDHAAPIAVPNDWLSKVVTALRRNLEVAVSLEAEIDPHGLTYIYAIEEDPDLLGQTSARQMGLTREVLSFVRLYKRLADIDVESARSEWTRWDGTEPIVFGRLKFWTCGLTRIIPDGEIAKVLLAVPSQIFWGAHHQRDLLLVLSARWKDLPEAGRLALEKRLLAGSQKKRFKKGTTEYLQYWAAEILDRLYWLSSRGCTFSFDLDKATARYRKLAPGWKPEFASRAATSYEPRSGFVETDTTFAELASVPIANLLQTAADNKRRDHDSLREFDPFAGLAEKRPVKALGALRFSTSSEDVISWGWQNFLGPFRREKEKPRLIVLIAGRLVTLPSQILTRISYSATAWVDRNAKELSTHDRTLFHLVLNVLIEVLRKTPDTEPSKIKSGARGRDWTQEALNSSVGNLAQAILKDSVLDNMVRNEGLPKDVRGLCEASLLLPADQGVYALTMFSRRLNWIYAVDPDWAVSTVIHAMTAGGNKQDAALAGFFLHSEVEGLLLFESLKPVLLSIVNTPTSRHRQAASWLFVSGWRLVEASGSRWSKTEQVRTVLIKADDDTRAHILWMISKWDLSDKVAFLTQAWPKQVIARGPVVSERLCYLALNDQENFPILLSAILPLVTKLKDGHSALHKLTAQDSPVAKKFPDEVLTLLWAVLDEETDQWPYGISNVLEQIAAAAPALRRDARLVELNRRLGTIR